MSLDTHIRTSIQTDEEPTIYDTVPRTSPRNKNMHVHPILSWSSKLPQPHPPVTEDGRHGVRGSRSLGQQATFFFYSERHANLKIFSSGQYQQQPQDQEQKQHDYQTGKGEDEEEQQKQKQQQQRQRNEQRHLQQQYNHSHHHQEQKQQENQERKEAPQQPGPINNIELRTRLKCAAKPNTVLAVDDDYLCTIREKSPVPLANVWTMESFDHTLKLHLQNASDPEVDIWVPIEHIKLVPMRSTRWLDLHD